MKHLQRLAGAIIAGLLFGPTSLVSPSAVYAQAAKTQITGSIVTQENGLGVGGASVTLYQGNTVVGTTTSNGDGQYTFPGVTPGEYAIAVRATGYTPTRVDSVIALTDSSTTIRTPLRRASTTGANGLREIGSTSATNRGANALASSATIQHNIDPEQIQRQGFLKAGDAIAQVPGLNLVGGAHTVGDDTTIDVRGMGAGEVRPLIDGHPIGPIGVLNQDYYNYVNSSYALLDDINVTVGSGATGLYGVDVIGGTIDFQTLSPTSRPHGELLQQFGDQGTSSTVAKATGTIGRFGYAVGHSVLGTFGDFAPGPIFQSARPNNNANYPNGGACTASNDLTSCNAALNTYSVSANFKQINELVKLRYSLTPTTALTVSGYSGNSHSDSTGNGDNDNIPYATRLGLVQVSKQTCPGGYLVVTDSNPNACYTAQQFAQASYGPFGGGEDRNRGTSLQDFNARLTSQIGVHALSFGAFSDYYNYHKYSSGAAGVDPTGTFPAGSGTYQDNYLTHGFLVTDDIANATNDLGFGYFVEHQKETGVNIAYDSKANLLSFVNQPNLGEGDYSFFLRENYVPNSKFAIYANVWDRRSSVTRLTKVDPRISFVVKPTRNDVVRLTAGQADGDPAANIAVVSSITSPQNPSSLNPVCAPNLLNPVATGGNSNLSPERSSDLEAAYGHRFWSDTSINVVGYVSSVKDQLFSGVLPITPFALANPSIAGSLAGFAQKINSACGTTYTASTIVGQLGLNGVFNASNALFRGIELTGRVRVAPWIALDYSYDIQSSQQFGEPTGVLINNPFILDGGQIVQVPVHKGSFAADYTGRNGYEAQLQVYYVGNNNTFNRPAYTFFNGFLSKTIAHNLTATVSVFNAFDQNSQRYGYFGEQLPNPENRFQPAYTNAVSQVVNSSGLATQNELLGLQPRSFTFSLSARM